MQSSIANKELWKSCPSCPVGLEPLEARDGERITLSNTDQANHVEGSSITHSTEPSIESWWISHVVGVEDVKDHLKVECIK